MGERKKDLDKRICVHLALCIVGILLLIFVFPPLLRLFMPIVIAWVIAQMANPMVRFLENKIKIMRRHGTVIVIIAVLALLFALIYLIVWGLVTQMTSLIGDLPELYTAVVNNLQESLAGLHQRYHIIPINLQAFWDSNDNKINDYILALLNSLQTSPIATVGSVASSLIDGFILTILTIMLSYFFVADGDEINAFIIKHTPKIIQNSVSMIWNTVIKAIGGYLKACLKIMGVMFLILWVIFFAAGVENAFLIAVITAILDFFPFVGTGTVLMPWAIYCVITGSYVRALVLVAAYFITLLTRRMLEPKLVGDSIGMSPFLTLLSMVIGYRLIGMLGLILGIPAAMILQVFYEKGLFERTIRGIRILARDISEYQRF